MPPPFIECAPFTHVVELLTENDDWRRSRNAFCRWSWMADGRFVPENWKLGNPGAWAASGGISMPSCPAMSPAMYWLRRLRESRLYPARNSLKTVGAKILVQPPATVTA